MQLLFDQQARKQMLVAIINPPQERKNALQTF